VSGVKDKRSKRGDIDRCNEGNECKAGKAGKAKARKGKGKLQGRQRQATD
jgi:hypothetical protein